MEILSRPEFVISALVLIIGGVGAWVLASRHLGGAHGSGQHRAERPVAPGRREQGGHLAPASSPGARVQGGFERGRAPTFEPPQLERPPQPVSTPANGGALSGAPAPRPSSADQRYRGPVVTFRDVAGLDEAIAELREVRDYLANPERFLALGADLPNGILLYGPPGNGKTLLAKALAGETGVPFYLVSAASFVEQYVGVGAARMRELFEEARRNGPAIVFIDEIDAVGRRRRGGDGGDREFDHTLNQLLVELDGSTASSGVLLLAATNRPELLDPALIRPGRFDRRIPVDPPDLHGREAILRLHASRRPLDSGVDWHDVSAHTAGLSASELANIVNEAALLAGRRSRKSVGQEDVEEAVARVLAGPRSSRVMSDREKRMIATHEAGHALLSLLLRGVTRPTRVSVVGRAGVIGRSTWSLAENQRVLTERELLSQLIILLAGRAAEIHTYGEPSTRAEDDLEEAGELARQMVQRWGMTGGSRRERVQGDGQGLQGLLGGQDHHVIPGLGVGDLMSRAERAALVLVGQHGECLRSIADLLAEHETLSLTQIASSTGVEEASLDPLELAAA